MLQERIQRYDGYASKGYSDRVQLPAKPAMPVALALGHTVPGGYLEGTWRVPGGYLPAQRNAEKVTMLDHQPPSFEYPGMPRTVLVVESGLDEFRTL
eukprot:1389705-Rhodomonas_salina.1